MAQQTVPTDQDIYVYWNDSSGVAYYEAEPVSEPSWRNSVSLNATSIKITQSARAYVLFNFTGSHFWYFGDLYPDHGNCSITMDDGVSTNVSSIWPYPLSVQTIFEAAVEPGPHVVNIRNLENKPMTIAYFVYSPVTTTMPTSSSTNYSGPSSSPTTTSHGFGLPVAAIIGISLSAATTILICFLAFVHVRDHGKPTVKQLRPSNFIYRA